MPNIYTNEDLTITGAADQLIYTCPPNTSAVITNATGANTGAAARLVSSDIVRGGGATSPETLKMINKAIQTLRNDFLNGLIGKNLAAGDEIYLSLDDTGTVNVTLDIREIVQ